MRPTRVVPMLVLVTLAAGAVAQDAPKPPPATPGPATPAPAVTPPATPAPAATVAAPKAPPASPYVLDFTMNAIDGTPKKLEDYKGKVIVMVNVASRCGFTPQYEGLEALYKEKKDAGLVVLGFPANDFKGQEPGTNKEIAEFCTSKYGVTFPMFEKIGVVGENAHPLYKRLAAQAEPVGKAPDWNFTKFVVDRDGKVVARFDKRIKASDPELRKLVDELLAKAPATGAAP